MQNSSAPRSADYVYLMEYAVENQKYLFPLDSVEFNTIQYRTIRLIEEMRSDHFGKETQIFLYVSDLRRMAMNQPHGV